MHRNAHANCVMVQTISNARERGRELCWSPDKLGCRERGRELHYSASDTTRFSVVVGIFTTVGL